MAGLFIHELTLSHFRSHRFARLVLDGRPVVIRGANGAGKTNILEAVSMLSPGRGLRRAAPEDLGRKPEGLGWKVIAGLQGVGADHEIETWAQGGPRQVRIDGKAVAQSALGAILRMLWITPAMDRLWIEGAEGRRRFLDRIALSFTPGHAEVSLTYEKAMRERNRLLRDGAGNAAWYGALEAQMAQAGSAIAANRAVALERIESAQAEALEHAPFPAAALRIAVPGERDGDCGAPHVGDADWLAIALAANRRRDMAAGRTLIGPHRVDLAAVWMAKGISAAMCSTGEQKALLISIVLANARALTAEIGAPPILLLDEVAAHLDENRRAALYDMICTMRVQAFMTGTDAGLFSAIKDRAQVFHVAETSEGGGSVVSAIAP